MNRSRMALEHLLDALENHYEVATSEADDAALTDAESQLRDAFFVYDDRLFTDLGVELPFEVIADDADDDDEEEIDDEDDEDLDYVLVDDNDEDDEGVDDDLDDLDEEHFRS